ncbi:Crp/Fnr family transcriptional regulator [Hydrogenimonas sp.]
MRKDSPLYREGLDVLKLSRLFGGLKEEELDTILQSGRITTYSKSESIDNDEGIECLNIIIKGAVKLSQIDPQSGRSITPFILHPGDIFDIFSLLDGERHISFPVALDETILLRTDMEEARKWLHEFPEFNKQMLPYLGGMMRELEAFSEALVFDDTATRLAKLILKHTHPEKSENNHFPVRLINKISHETLAEMIGSVRSVVTTQLNKMKAEGLILSRRGELLVKELEQLKERYNL